MKSKVVPHRRRLLVLATLAGTLAVAILAAGASVAAADPPIVSIGPVTSPDGTVTAAGTAAQDAETDGCVNDQHSGADPSAPDADSTVQVNDSACQASGAQPTNSQTSASQAGRSSTGGSPSSTSAPSAGSAPSSSSATTTKAAMTVAAANARGLRIAAIRYTTKGIRSSKMLGVRVAIHDADGNLVRDAIVTVKGVPGARYTIDCTHATYSNGAGLATFTVPVTAKMIGKRVLLAVAARTPSARASRIGAVRLG
jgi:hypothetical protein